MIEKYMAFMQAWLQTLDTNLPPGKKLTVYTPPRSRAAVRLGDSQLDERPPTPRIRIQKTGEDLPTDKALNQGGPGVRGIAYRNDKRTVVTSPTPRTISITYQVDIFTDTEADTILLLEGDYMRGQTGLYHRFASGQEARVPIYIDPIWGVVPVHVYMEGQFADVSELEGTEPPVIRTSGTMRLDGFLFFPPVTEPSITKFGISVTIGNPTGEMESLAALRWPPHPEPWTPDYDEDKDVFELPPVFVPENDIDLFAAWVRSGVYSEEVWRYEPV